MQTLFLHLQSSGVIGTFLWLPLRHLQTAREKKKANIRPPVKAAHSERCQSEAKNCSLSGLLAVSPNAQLNCSSTHQVHSNHHTVKKTDRTQAIDNMAGSYLSLLLGYSCSRPSLPPFLFLPLCSNKHSLLSVVELCWNPRVCWACHCSGCLHAAGNNKKGLLFKTWWITRSPFTCLTPDARVRGQVVGRMKLFHWNKHNIVDSTGTLLKSRRCHTTAKNCFSIYWALVPGCSA